MCEVNLADDESFKDNLDLLESYQQAQYDQAFSPYKRMGTYLTKFREAYYDNARFIIYSELPFSSKYSRCGTKINGLAGNCKKRMFCTCCAYKDATNLFDRYKDSFLGRTFYSVTFAYDGGLPWDDRKDSAHYWQAADYALDKLIEEEKLDGALVSREMSIFRFLPLRINPHAHAVVVINDFHGEFELLQELQDYAARHHADSGEGER